MTREKIREGLKTFFKEWDESGMITFDCECAECISDRDIFINALCEYLHSQGLVLKVERELPKNPCFTSGYIANYERSQEDMLEAGYEAVIPLN